MTDDKIAIEMLDEGDDEGPGGTPPPQKCPVCGRLLAVCMGQHDEPTDPGVDP